MKIAIINQYMSTATLGGHRHRHSSLAKGFVQQGSDVLLVTSSYSHVPPRSTKFKGLSLRVNDESGASIIVLKTLSYRNPNSVLRVINWLVFALQLLIHSRSVLSFRPTHIIVSSLSLFPVLVVACCWKKTFKFIFEIRDIWPLTYTMMKNKDGSSLFEKVLLWIEGIGLKRSELVVGLMPLYNNYARERSIDIDNKYLWLPNGIHMSEGRSNSYEGINASNRVKIVYTGSFGVVNKIELLLKTVSLLDPKDFELCIAGSGPREEIVRAYARKYEHIKFLGRIPSSSVLGLLESSDIAYLGVVNSDLYEYGISPNKLYDYMNAGLPILLCSRYNSGVDPDTRFTITCDSEDVKKVKQKLIEFKELPNSKRKAMRLASKEAGLSFRYDVLSEKYLKYMSCL